MGGLEDRWLGQYHIKAYIGSGGVGDVYLADDSRLQREVALKVVRHELEPGSTNAAVEQATRQFQEEALVVAGLEHPNILQIYDFGEQERRHYLVMPYLPDGSLADMLTPGPKQRLYLPLPPLVAATIIDQAAAALQYAHDRSIIHRDVKPHNLLVRVIESSGGVDMTPRQATSGTGGPSTVRLHILLADFGLARFLANMPSRSQTTGTPLYTAPEQYAGHPEKATDQYALACVAYLLLTGHPIFTGATPAALQHQHLSEMPVSVRALNASLPPAVEPVLARALAKDPRQRYERVLDFANALHTAVDPTFQTSQYIWGAPGVPGQSLPQSSVQSSGQSSAQGSSQWQVQTPYQAPFMTPHGAPGEWRPTGPYASAGPAAAPTMTGPSGERQVRGSAPPFVSTGGPAMAGYGRPDGQGAQLPSRRPKALSRRTLLIGASALVGAGVLGAGGYVFATRRPPASAPKLVARQPQTVGIYRPSTGTFYLATTLDATGSQLELPFGEPGQLPVVGDWTGRGIDAIGIFHPKTATFWLKDHNDSAAQPDHAFVFGRPGDLPVAGDWTGQGRDGIGVYRPSTGTFYLRETASAGAPDYTLTVHGAAPTDLPVAGDWTGSGSSSVGLYRPTDSTFHLYNAVCNCAPVLKYNTLFGFVNDVPFAGRWTNQKVAGLGIFRPKVGSILLKYVPLGSATSDLRLTLGQDGDVPVAGHWQ